MGAEWGVQRGNPTAGVWGVPTISLEVSPAHWGKAGGGMSSAQSTGGAIGSRPPWTREGKGETTMGGFTRAQVQLLVIGAVAMLLPLCFIIVILAINFGGSQ